MNEQKTYIGITLGPIDRIMGYAKSTRSIWASSYLFSFISKHIVAKYYYNRYRFLKPWMTKEMFDRQDGVGRFPDQYIFEAEENISVAAIREECDSVIGDLATNIADVLNKSADKKDILDYLKQTIRVIIIKQNFSTSVDDSEIVASMQCTMAALECRDTFCAEEKSNYLADYFESTSANTLLYMDAFNKITGGRLFDTIIECSAGNDYDGTRADLLNGKLDSKLKPYQKYIAFVSADGDNFGKTLAVLGDKVGNVFSNYNREIRGIVNAYGGQVIYQGGDDILFFAPVYNRLVKKDIFQLIMAIDEKFQSILDGNQFIKKMVNKPSISYGISVSYYKFPMAEARLLSKDLLDEIKNVPVGNTKNRIRWKVRKHSGQSFGGEIDKNVPGVQEINKRFIASCMSKDGAFLHSVTHWLTSQKAMLTVILNRDADTREDCLNNYVSNSFDEPIHQNYDTFFQAMKAYLLFFPNYEGVSRLHVLMRYIELLIKKD